MNSAIFSDLSGDMFLRLALDLVGIAVLVRGVYFRTYGKTDLMLSFFALNVIIFFIAYVLNRVEIGLGAAFGLFAVFSMLRYRTEGISTTDMTYLFAGIALGLIMAVAQTGWAELLLIAGIVIGTIQLLESGWIVRREASREVHYDRVSLLGPSGRSELLADLKGRTGLDVRRVEIREIDLVRDSARIVVYYPDERAPRPGK